MVPNYKELRVTEILWFTASNFRRSEYLPEYQFIKEPNHEWLYNFSNFPIPDEFEAYIKVKVD